jgi:probable phosphoglycerate mutase
MEVALVRHGATEWSRDGRHTGRTDLPLLDDGRREAEAIGRLLAGRSFALVLVSPLERARETCRLAGFGDRAEVEPDLREWDYGAYEGITTQEIRESVPGWTVWTHRVPDGETIAQVAARAERVIARARAAGGDVALFAHAHILRVLTARWCELPPEEGRRFPLGTGTLSVLGFEREYTGVRLWNGRG